MCDAQSARPGVVSFPTVFQETPVSRKSSSQQHFRSSQSTVSWRSLRGFRPCLEQLMDRIVPAISLSFDGDLLTVTSDGTADLIEIETDPGTGNVLLNGQPTGATLITLDRLIVNGNGGGDWIEL